MKCQIHFSWKIRKYFNMNLSSAELVKRVVKIKLLSAADDLSNDK